MSRVTRRRGRFLSHVVLLLGVYHDHQVAVRIAASSRFRSGHTGGEALHLSNSKIGGGVGINCSQWLSPGKFHASANRHRGRASGTVTHGMMEVHFSPRMSVLSIMPILFATFRHAFEYEITVLYGRSRSAWFILRGCVAYVWSKHT